MRENWDAIVIGAGIGGLTAAAHLVKAGLRVLVLERNPHIGGTAYVYHRKGFPFPMGPLGFSHPGLVQNTLKDLGVGEDLKFSRVHYRMRAFDLDLPLSLPFTDMVKPCQNFPRKCKAVEHFFKAKLNDICWKILNSKSINLHIFKFLHSSIFMA
jgi:phytoene dehydrogenase-like protein